MSDKGEQCNVNEAVYPLWRYHLWHVGFGSYNEIEAAIDTGSLQPFTCTKADCDCKWPKAAKVVAQPAGVEGVVDLPPSMRTNINSIARHIAAPAKDQGADVSEVIERATCALTLLVQTRPAATNLAERARRVADTMLEQWPDLAMATQYSRAGLRLALVAIITAEFGGGVK